MGDLKAPVTRVTETIKTLGSHINYKTGDTWKSNTRIWKPQDLHL